MRLIGRFEEETRATRFYGFLLNEGCSCKLEAKENNGQVEYLLWVENEDDVENAQKWFASFQQNPEDPQFEKRDNVLEKELVPEENIPNDSKPKIQLRLKKIKHAHSIFTKWIILLCVVIFIVNEMQKETPESKLLGLTPMTKSMLYDYPERIQRLGEVLNEEGINTAQEYQQWIETGPQILQEVERIPEWQGIYHLLEKWPQSKSDLSAPLFKDIRQGELWRTISPVILHANILHILFNMLWLWFLGRLVESRIGIIRYLVISVIIGLVSNAAQYLMSGPLFMGYSGIIAGLAGFIYIRQKNAPWEGYPIQKATWVFLGAFIFGMALLQFGMFLLNRYYGTDLPSVLANTAHITGVFVGMILAKIPLCYKRSKV